MPSFQQLSTADHIHARGLGIDLTDSERVRALRYERDAAFEAIDRLQGYLAAELASVEKWKHRWMVTFGFLLFLVIVDLIAAGFWMLPEEFGEKRANETIRRELTLQHE